MPVMPPARSTRQHHKPRILRPKILSLFLVGKLDYPMYKSLEFGFQTTAPLDENSSLETGFVLGSACQSFGAKKYESRFNNLKGLTGCVIHFVEWLACISCATVRSGRRHF